MEKYEQLIKLLEKKNLTSKEQELLSALIKDNRDFQDYFRIYKSLENTIPLQEHPGIDTLSEYILYKNNNSVIKDAWQSLIPRIEKHLRECEHCNEIFQLLDDEYYSIDNYLNENIVKETKPVKKELKIRNLLLYPKFTFARISFASVLLIGIIYFVLYFISSFSISPAEKYASLNNKPDYYISRGRATDEFQKGLIALENGDYNRTIQFLNEDINNNPDDETIFYSYYILGLIKLESAQTDILGLFPSYNKADVLSGIQDLQESINKNNSGQFSNINYDACFFIAKGNLMLNNIPQAKKYLKLVIFYKGSKVTEAKEILNELK